MSRLIFVFLFSIYSPFVFSQKQNTGYSQNIRNSKKDSLEYNFNLEIYPSKRKPKGFWSRRLESYWPDEGNYVIEYKKMSLTTIVGVRLLDYSLPNIYLSGNDILIKKLQFSTPLERESEAKELLLYSLVKEFNIKIDTIQKKKEVYVLSEIPIISAGDINLVNGEKKHLRAFNSLAELEKKLENALGVEVGFSDKIQIDEPFFMDFRSIKNTLDITPVAFFEKLDIVFFKKTENINCLTLHLQGPKNQLRRFYDEYSDNLIW